MAQRQSAAAALFDDNFGADGDFFEKFGGVWAAQADAAVGGGVAGELAFVEADFAAGEAHEEGHVGRVEGGTPFAVFVGDNVFAGRRAVAWAAGGDGGAGDGDAVAEEDGLLGFEVDFDLDASGVRSGRDAEQGLHDVDVSAFAGEPESEGFVAFAAGAGRGTVVEKEAHHFVIAESGGEHERGYAAFNGDEVVQV